MRAIGVLIVICVVALAAWYLLARSRASGADGSGGASGGASASGPSGPLNGLFSGGASKWLAMGIPGSGTLADPLSGPGGLVTWGKTVYANPFNPIAQTRTIASGLYSAGRSLLSW